LSALIHGHAEVFKRVTQEVLGDWVRRRTRRLLEEIRSRYPYSATPLPDSLESELIESLSPIHVFNGFVDIHMSFENLDELRSVKKKLLELATQNDCALHHLWVLGKRSAMRGRCKACGEQFIKVFLMYRKTIEFIDVCCPAPLEKLEHLESFTNSSSTSQQPQ
jgi:hypothetical protein